MEDEKFNIFVNCVSESFISVAEMVAELEFTECSKEKINEERKYSVIVGMVGKNKGRILFEAGAGLVKKLTEAMNEGPINNIMDTYICLCEFANMFCGNSVTKINNKYKGNDIRLTPPTIFCGVELNVVTPNIHFITTCYNSKYGMATLDIGFEGE